LAVDDQRAVDLREDGLGELTVLADTLDLEHAAVGGEADGPQRGQVAETAAETEVAGVVDGVLGAQRTLSLKYCLMREDW
jgi:hypothetical protein